VSRDAKQIDAEFADETETCRIGLHDLTRKEKRAIRQGLAELDRGEWTSEETMQTFWVRCGVL
jgi:hypothetical protein